MAQPEAGGGIEKADVGCGGAQPDGFADADGRPLRGKELQVLAVEVQVHDGAEARRLDEFDAGWSALPEGDEPGALRTQPDGDRAGREHAGTARTDAPELLAADHEAALPID
jgi:hypothetical protein